MDEQKRSMIKVLLKILLRCTIKIYIITQTASLLLMLIYIWNWFNILI